MPKLSYKNIKTPTRIVGGQLCKFRSGWEYNIAKWLQWKVETGLIDKWEYEPQSFLLKRSNGKTVGYLPDFRVIKGAVSWYVEVKGRLDATSRMKIRLFREQVGELELIDATMYHQIKNVFGGKLGF